MKQGVPQFNFMGQVGPKIERAGTVKRISPSMSKQRTFTTAERSDYAYSIDLGDFGYQSPKHFRINKQKLRQLGDKAFKKASSLDEKILAGQDVKPLTDRKALYERRARNATVLEHYPMGPEGQLHKTKGGNGKGVNIVNDEVLPRMTDSSVKERSKAARPDSPLAIRREVEPPRIIDQKPKAVSTSSAKPTSEPAKQPSSDQPAVKPEKSSSKKAGSKPNTDIRFPAATLAGLATAGIGGKMYLDSQTKAEKERSSYSSPVRLYADFSTPKLTPQELERKRRLEFEAWKREHEEQDEPGNIRSTSNDIVSKAREGRGWINTATSTGRELRNWYGFLRG
ncbi:hypothetical protein [Chroococcidiopsis sp.]|uniref:hypothetical protein n=1 Tax=Chroococcidiopsis sp. TaxID=3088168 RepID=UPI003F3AA3A4